MKLTIKEIKQLIKEELNKIINESDSLDKRIKEDIISKFKESEYYFVDINSIRPEFIQSIGNFMIENTSYLGDQAELFKEKYHSIIESGIEENVLMGLQFFSSLVDHDKMPEEEKQKLSNLLEFPNAKKKEIRALFPDIIEKHALKRAMKYYEDLGGDQLIVDIKKIIDLGLKLTHDMMENKRAYPLKHSDIPESFYETLSLAEKLGYVYDAGENFSYYYVERYGLPQELKDYINQKWNEITGEQQ